MECKSAVSDYSKLSVEIKWYREKTTPVKVCVVRT